MHRKALAFLVAAAALAAAPAAAQTPLRAGQTVSGTLDASSPRMEDGAPYDRYVIRGRPGDRVLVRMRSDDFDTYLHWGRASGAGDWSETAGNDDSGEGTDSRLLVRLGEDGEYELRAAAFSEDVEGAYTLELAEVAAPVPARARVGQTVRGELTAADTEGESGFQDHFRIAGRAGEPVTLFLDSEDFDAYLEAGNWVDGDFEELAADDDGGEMTHAQLVTEIGRGGEVYVIVRSWSPGATGAYTLRVEPGAIQPEPDEWEQGELDVDTMVDAEGWGDTTLAPVDGPARLVGTFAGPVRAGEDVAGTLGQDDEQPEGTQYYRDYSYRAAAGEQLTIQVMSSEFDPYVSIGAERGDAFAQMAEDDDGGEGLDSRLEFDATEGGTYTIRVTSAFPDQAGAYTLRVQRER